jgi:hypothetical protein
MSEDPRTNVTDRQSDESAPVQLEYRSAIKAGAIVDDRRLVMVSLCLALIPPSLVGLLLPVFWVLRWDLGRRVILGTLFCGIICAIAGAIAGFVTSARSPAIENEAHAIVRDRRLVMISLWLAPIPPLLVGLLLSLLWALGWDFGHHVTLGALFCGIICSIAGAIAGFVASVRAPVRRPGFGYAALFAHLLWLGLMVWLAGGV